MTSLATHHKSTNTRNPAIQLQKFLLPLFVPLPNLYSTAISLITQSKAASQDSRPWTGAAAASASPPYWASTYFRQEILPPPQSPAIQRTQQPVPDKHAHGITWRVLKHQFPFLQLQQVNTKLFHCAPTRVFDSQNCPQLNLTATIRQAIMTGHSPFSSSVQQIAGLEHYGPSSLVWFPRTNSTHCNSPANKV